MEIDELLKGLNLPNEREPLKTALFKLQSEDIAQYLKIAEALVSVFIQSVEQKEIIQSTFSDIDKNKTVEGVVKRHLRNGETVYENIAPNMLAVMIITYYKIQECKTINLPQNLDILISGKPGKLELSKPEENLWIKFLDHESILELGQRIFDLYEKNPSVNKKLSNLCTMSNNRYPFKLGKPFVRTLCYFMMVNDRVTKESKIALLKEEMLDLFYKYPKNKITLYKSYLNFLEYIKKIESEPNIS